MASILRQIVAGPRSRHPEAGLDLCYVTDFIIATSGPSQTYPQLAYRNPLDQLVAFLDSKHGEDWAIWEFRAEGTGYPDDAVYNRIRHYPWPDHHPPPFRLIPLMMANMRNWLHGGDISGAKAGDIPSTESDNDTVEKRDKKRVVVVHCKAGKGRSGTASCSYLIAEEGWKMEEALARFTERRMRPKFGAGVSIPSQLRWITYVDRWARNGKKYRDRPIEIVEIHVWGLRSGVKVDVEGFEDEGKAIRTVHTFKKEERVVVEGGEPDGGGLSDFVWELAGYTATGGKNKSAHESHIKEDGKDESKPSEEPVATPSPTSESKPAKLKRKGTDLMDKVSPPGSHQSVDRLRAKTGLGSSSSSVKSSDGANDGQDDAEPGGMAVILRPAKPISLPNSDVNVAVERRNRTHKSMGLTMVSAVAHVWFNTFFEGQGPEQTGEPKDSGVFTIDWEAMDGIKGSSRKGARALDRMAVVWRAADTATEEDSKKSMDEPAEGQEIPQPQPADWKGGNAPAAGEKELGLRVQSPASADVSRASSMRSNELHGGEKDAANDGDSRSMEGLKCSGPTGDELLDDDLDHETTASKGEKDEITGRDPNLA